MNALNPPGRVARRRLTASVLAATLVALTAASVPAVAHEQNERIVPPLVPEKLEADAGSRPFLIGHAIGTQNYDCLPSGAGFAWVNFSPQATLFDDDRRQIITHFLSPNPDENGNPPRATWQSSRDTSAVSAAVKQPSSDPAFVAPGAIPWLLLDVVGTRFGPTWGGKLVKTTQIQRINTHGGIAPTTGCAGAADVGKKALVPYSADYVFYRN
jgi:hypothetical protein